MVDAERKTTVALVEGVLVESGAVVEAGDGALVGVAPRAGAVVDAERQTAVALVEGVLVESGAVLEAVDGALVGVAPRAGAMVEAERQTAVALVDGVLEPGAVVEANPVTRVSDMSGGGLI